MRKPPAHRVHLALILTQCLFGVGSVVGRLGVASFNPMVFALIREASEQMATAALSAAAAVPWPSILNTGIVPQDAPIAFLQGSSS